jgi:L-arabinose transport system ATP-binding protein
MDEVLELSDAYVVLRDGRVVGERSGPGTHEDELIRLMIGRDLEDVFERHSTATSDVVLTLESYETDKVGPLSMEVRAGEVVGVAGLVGSGRSRLIRAIGGVDAGTSGRMTIKGRAVSLRGSSDAISSGIAMCPEDRKKLALFPDRSVAENMQVGVWRSGLADVLRHPRAERQLVADYIERLGIRPADPKRPVRTLSGGNAQKVVLARSLALRPDILLLDEPTRGIDVGAKSDIYRIIRDLASEGVAVVITSSELIEVLGLSDRIYVMRSGAIVGELSAGEADEESIMRLAISTQHQRHRRDPQ